MQTHRAVHHHRPRLVPALPPPASAWHHFTPFMTEPRPRSRWALRAGIAAGCLAIAAGLVWVSRAPSAKTLRAEITDLRVSGQVPLHTAQPLLDRERDRFEACFTRAGVDGAGTMPATVVLAANGTARHVELSPGKGNVFAAAPCVAGILRELTGPGGRELTLQFTVTYR